MLRNPGFFIAARPTKKPVHGGILAGTEAFSSYFDGMTTEETPSPDNPTPPKIMSCDAYCPVILKYVDEDGHKYYESFLNSTIEGIHEYFNLLETLGLMEEGDQIEIYIASPGGLICSGSAISSMITECKGKVITIATGICASAGSLIWSAGHECLVFPTAVLMWHMSSHGAQGNSKLLELEARRMVDHVRDVFLAASARKGHITEEEVQIICSEPNREIWISAGEMQQRLDAANQQPGTEE